MEIMQFVSQLLNGDIDIDDLAQRAAEQAAPPMLPTPGPAEEIGEPSMTVPPMGFGGAAPEQGGMEDPLAALKAAFGENVGSVAAPEAYSPPTPGPMVAPSPSRGVQGLSPQVAAVPQMPQVTLPPNLQALLQGAFKQ